MNVLQKRGEGGFLFGFATDRAAAAEFVHRKDAKKAEMGPFGPLSRLSVLAVFCAHVAPAGMSDRLSVWLAGYSAVEGD